MAVSYLDDSSGAGVVLNGGTWTTLGTGFGGYLDQYSYERHYGGGDNNAEYTFTVTAGTYSVAITWVHAANRRNPVTVKVYDNVTEVASTTVNQINAPSGFTDAGVTWQTIEAAAVISSTTLKVVIVAGPSVDDSYVIADGVRIDGPTSSGSASQIRRFGRPVIGSTGVRIY